MPHVQPTLTPLQQANNRLQAYLKAEAAVLENQAYEIGGRRLTRANLAEIQAGIREATAQVTLLSQSGLRRRFGYIRHG